MNLSCHSFNRINGEGFVGIINCYRNNRTFCFMWYFEGSRMKFQEIFLIIRLAAFRKEKVSSPFNYFFDYLVDGLHLLPWVFFIQLLSSHKSCI